MEGDINNILATLDSQLQRPQSDSRPVILMTCGIAGSGKSTLARSIVAKYPSFNRISIDTIVAERHGIYGIDYPADLDLFASYQTEANDIYLSIFQRLLEDRKNIVLDRSFYAKKDRDEFKQMIEDGGGRWILVYFRADKETLWRRINERKAQGKNADSAFEISREILNQYVKGWEAPQGEGEIVFDVM